MSAGFFRRENEIEGLLRAARPRVPEELASRLVARATPVRIRGRVGSRLALAGAVTALMVVALASVGGIGYAASTITSVVREVTHQKVFMGSRMTLQVKQNAASTDQYGQSTNSQTTSGDTLISDAQSTSSSTVDLTVNASTTSTQPVATVAIPTQLLTGSNPIVPPGGTISLDPTPPSAATSIGSGNAAIGIKVVDASGNVIHPTLTAPVSVTLNGPFDPTFVPCIDKEDGNGCQQTTALAGPETTCPLSNGKADGYYHSGSNIVIETCHLTIFAVVYKGNLSVSESGRKFQKAGSGLFGDPELIAPGKAQLKQVGSTTVGPFRKGSGKAVGFHFFVNEQVSAYVSVYLGNTKLPIALKGTMIRGTTLTKAAIARTVHIPVLRPGTLNIRLHIPGSHLVAGKKYRIRVAVLDYDGNKTVAFIPFTG